MPLHYFLEYLKKCQDYLAAIHKDEALSWPFLWIDSIWSFIIYGCTIRQYRYGHFYRLRHFERRRVVTTRKYFKLIAINDKQSIHWLENKRDFNKMFSHFVHRDWLESSSMSFESFKALYMCSERLFIKPIEGTEGKGIRILDCASTSINQIREMFESLKGTNCIIEKAVLQHPQMEFNTKAVNTIRVLSIMDKATQEVTVFKTVIRIGNKDALVDNYHQGGCVYDIDINSGRICSSGISISGETKVFHHGTDICMLGYQIPNWDMVIDSCMKAHKLLPSCRYIAWDVAILNEGVELIEGNHRGDYDMIEFVGCGKWWPFLKQYL